MAKTIAHIITNLSSGGAERMLWKLLAQQAAAEESGFRHCVLSLIGSEFIGKEIEALGIPVHCLGLSRSKLPSLSVLREMFRVLRQYEPDVLQGWMYHGNLAAWAASRFGGFGKAALCFNVRHSISDLRHESRFSRAVIRLGSYAARRADAVIYNSETSAMQHERLGYPPSRRELIANGFELERYKPDAALRRGIRDELRVTENDFVVALIGRFHPMKDHATFLAAAKTLLTTNSNIVFALVGREVTEENEALGKLLPEGEPRKRVLLLGERTDIAAVLNGVDLLVSCSAWGEGFSNVLGEACASALPVIATDVGDSRRIVGEHGLITPIGDAEALARNIRQIVGLSEDERRALGAHLRAGIVERYSLGAVTAQYHQLYSKLLS